jgi:hypothetical protein
VKPTRRLLSEGATEFERQLLRSVIQERPSALHRARLLQGMGLTGPAFWAATAQAMVATTVGKVALGVAAAGLIGSATLPLARDTLAARAREARVEVMAPAVSASAPVAAPAPVEPAAIAADEPDAPPSAGLSSAAPSSVVEEPMSALRAQIELLDAARSAVGEHDPHRALALLARYERDFPRGTLQREALLLKRAAQKREPRAYAH